MGNINFGDGKRLCFVALIASVTRRVLLVSRFLYRTANAKFFVSRSFASSSHYVNKGVTGVEKP